MAVDLDISDWTVQLDGARNGNYPKSLIPSGAAFTPMIAENFASQTLGQTYPNGTWATNRSTTDNTRAFSGTQSMKIQTLQGSPPATCGGGTWYGGYQSLPAPVPVGKTLWFRAKFYFPSTFGWGYTYATSDSAEASTCSKPADGNGTLKFMALAPTTGTARIYLLPPVQRRNTALPTTNITKLLAETGANLENFNDVNGKFTLDEWQDVQISVTVDDSASGVMRYWRNGVFIGEVLGANASAGNSLAEWRIGDYWNGVPFFDGVATDSFWMDEVILASDVDGYGAPSGVDAGGRVFIDPETLVEGLS